MSHYVLWKIKAFSSVILIPGESDLSHLSDCTSIWCSLWIALSFVAQFPIFLQDGLWRSAWEGWCSHSHLGLREERFLGVRSGWQRGEAAAPWECRWFSLKEKQGRKKLETNKSIVSSEQQSLQRGARHHSCFLGVCKSEKEQQKSKYILCFYNSVYFPQYLSNPQHWEIQKRN